ncbi:MAG TPA: short-chain fatty acid transporter [Flavobacteriales bacterium]|nr:short-chain fatty acid transporter [Crocinitomicaceae bacterium]HAE30528.1 short-chain fatty acid transporter [Flavobacteriales bacterium]
MSFTEKYAKVFKALLPTPFTIAIVLTAITFAMALALTKPSAVGLADYSFELLGYWEKGLGGSGGLAFALQMMLMLVLGHVLALSRPINSLLNRMVSFCNTTATAALFVTLIAVVCSMFNWGFGLIIGAIIARKVGERAASNNISINYPLIGAAGYSGLMVWHGGLSGSAPLKIAEENGMDSLFSNYPITQELKEQLPTSVPFDETVFSPMNLTIAIALIVVLPVTMFILAKITKSSKVEIQETLQSVGDQPNVSGAERLDHSRILCLTIGLTILIYALLKIFWQKGPIGWSFINPNYINLVLLGLCFVFHLRFADFLRSVDSAIGGAAGILIQFPLYFGIMGIMSGSGMMTDISNFFVAHSTDTTHPIFTFISAGLVNVLVPSGGGQWAVQGPIIIESSIQQGLPLGKGIMAMSYGDQLTNMLQPFWALPLLAITGLKAKDILPYTLIIMLIGIVIFISGLLLF